MYFDLPSSFSCIFHFLAIQPIALHSTSFSLLLEMPTFPAVKVTMKPWTILAQFSISSMTSSRFKAAIAALNEADGSSASAG